MLDNIAYAKTTTALNHINPGIIKQCVEGYIENLRADPGDIKFEMKRVECEKLKDKIRVLEMEIWTLNGEFHQDEKPRKKELKKPKKQQKKRSKK